MVERTLPKPDTRVRFPSAAPQAPDLMVWGFIFWRVEAVCSLLLQGTRPRFASDTLMSRRGISIPLRICGSGVRGIPPVRWVAWWFSVCAPCLANWRGEGCRGLACCLVVGCFACGAGEGCRVLVCCVVVSLVRAEVSVPSVATSGCPKRSEGGCPCRSEDVHRPQVFNTIGCRYAKARHCHKTAAGNHFKKS